MTRILLAGATGLVGGLALDRLLADARVTQVVAPTRRRLRAHSRLLNPLVEAAALPVDADWWTVDGAICALGTTRAKTPNAAAYRAIDHDYPLAIAERVRAAGARRFALVTSMGASPRSWFRYTRIKGELEAAIGQLAFPSLTIVRPGFLAGARDEYRPMERELVSVWRALDPVLPAAARASPAATVADLLVEAAIAGDPGLRVVGAAEIARAGFENRRSWE